jgi:peptide/nickel transport system permease protein
LLVFAYIARRIVYVIPIVASVALVCFLLVHITPGDPLVAVLPADASQELAAQLRTAYGFDRPLPVQFGLWLWRALHGISAIRSLPGVRCCPKYCARSATR